MHDGTVFVWCYGSCHGADWTPLTVRTGIMGCLSLHVNRADRTPVLFTAQSCMRQRGKDCGKGVLKER